MFTTQHITTLTLFSLDPNLININSKAQHCYWLLKGISIVRELFASLKELPNLSETTLFSIRTAEHQNRFDIRFQHMQNSCHMTL